jgi:hypothetical protein
VFRLLRGLKQDGATSLLSKHRGEPSNHRLPAEVRTLALSIVREGYADFGPTLAAEKLAEHHGCSVSRETLARSVNPAAAARASNSASSSSVYRANFWWGRCRFGFRFSAGSAGNSMISAAAGRVMAGPCGGSFFFGRD